MHNQRIRKVQEYIKAENLDGFIVTRLVNIRYLCGYTGSSGVLIITPDEAFFMTDFRYKEQANQEVRGANVIISKGDTISAIKEQKRFRGKNLRYGYESEFLSCRDYKRIQEGLEGSILVSTTDVVENISVIKDAAEIALIQKAVDITDVVFERILGYLRPGLRETEIRAEMEYQMMSLGSEKPAFETIVASGYRSAMPHGIASEKKLKKGEFVTLDFGASFKGYVADLTRTVVLGKATPRQKRIYNIVLKAQLAAIKRVRSGKEGKAIDSMARDIIEKEGFGKYFGHGLGHGIGIYIHSKPSLGPRSVDILKKGMVMTIEPGIYLPKWGGVRIEDDVLVTATGCRTLNRATKNLLEV
jgi:Xaa-Pro aminopeptidase